MLYHERARKNKENANCVLIVYLLAKLCNIFNEAFLLTSVYVLYDSNLTSKMVFLQRYWIEYYRVLSVVNCRVAIHFTFNDSC